VRRNFASVPRFKSNRTNDEAGSPREYQHILHMYYSGKFRVDGTRQFQELLDGPWKRTI
jgi:hypothetical protein